jgi:hypothetical protein
MILSRVSSDYLARDWTTVVLFKLRAATDWLRSLTWNAPSLPATIWGGALDAPRLMLRDIFKLLVCKSLLSSRWGCNIDGCYCCLLSAGAPPLRCDCEPENRSGCEFWLETVSLAPTNPWEPYKSLYGYCCWPPAYIDCLPKSGRLGLMKL